MSIVCSVPNGNAKITVIFLFQFIMFCSLGAAGVVQVLKIFFKYCFHIHLYLLVIILFVSSSSETGTG